MKMPDSVSDPKIAVALARVEGSIKQLTDTVALRITHVENDLARVDRKAESAHTRLDVGVDKLRGELVGKIASLQGTVEEFEKWKQRVVGFSIALGAVGGGAGGLVFSAFSRAVEGG
jgi:hypothetical protein